MAEVQRTLPGVPASPRPRRSDPPILVRAAELLAPAVIAWINEAALVDEVVGDLADALRVRPDADGYALARHLEDRHGYAPDSGLVDVLDSAFSHLWSALNDATEAWVEAEGIVLDLAIGQTVTTRLGKGMIADVKPKTAQYIVAITPEDRARSGSGYVLSAEDVTAAPTLEEEAAHG